MTGGPPAPGVHVVIGPDTRDTPIGGTRHDSVPGQDAPPLTLLQRNLAELYEVLLDEYNQALGQPLDPPPEGQDPGPAYSGYPALTVRLSQDEAYGIGPDESVDVVFDETLYQQLFLLYCSGGWACVAAVDRALAALAPAPDESLPGGTAAVTKWSVAYRFFRSVATVLALLIREALVTLERRSAEMLEIGLRRFVKAYKQAWDLELQFREGPVLLHVNVNQVTYTYGPVIGDPGTSTALLEELRAAVSVRDEIAGLQEMYKEAKEQGEAAEAANLTAHLEQAQASLAEQLRHLHLNSPFALLVFPHMKSYWTQDDLGYWLGHRLKGFGPRAEALARSVDPADSRTLRLLLPEIGATGAADRSQLLHFDPRGPESALVREARRAYSKDKGCAPLLLERLWHLLAQGEAVPKGSFEQIVHLHYTVRLIQEQEADRAAEEETYEELGRAAAVLSLLLLTGPVGAVGLLLRGAQLTLDLIMIGAEMSTALSALDEASLQLTDAMAAPGSLSMDGLAEVAKVASYREEIITGLGVNLVLTLAGFGLGRIRLPRGLQVPLLTWSFLQDVKTLVEP